MFFANTGQYPRKNVTWITLCLVALLPEKYYFNGLATDRRTPAEQRNQRVSEGFRPTWQSCFAPVLKINNVVNADLSTS
jgi:hypothetical protein